MSIEQELKNRSGSVCELCGSEPPLVVYAVQPSDGTADQSIIVCETCHEHIEDPAKMIPNHWRSLSNSMWSEVPAVQVMAYRLLKRLSNEGWASSLLDSLYLEPDIQVWADAEAETSNEAVTTTKDSNGTELQEGDTVTLIKDLEVKGAGFTAKRGTAVRNISLTNDPEAIEGRVNGVKIVLKTCFLKRS